MIFAVFSLFSQLSLVSWGDIFKWGEWYDRLFTPQISITLTLVVCLIVIWIIGTLFDNWFKNRKFVLAIIKTTIIGIILFSIMETSPKGKAGDNKGGGAEPPITEVSETGNQENSQPVKGGEEGREGNALPPPPKTRTRVDITITYSKEGARIDKEKEPLKNATDIFNRLKSYLKDDEHCFGTITITRDKSVSEVDTTELQKLLRGYHNLQNNTTEIDIPDQTKNTTTGDKK